MVRDAASLMAAASVHILRSQIRLACPTVARRLVSPVSEPARLRTNAPLRRQLSLERRLPLLISTLLSAVLIVSLLLAYREIEESARLAGSERLHRISRQLAELASSSTQTRISTLARVAAHDEIRRALEAPATTPDSATLAILSHAQAPTDSGLPVVLLTHNGKRVGGVGLDLVENGPLPHARDEVMARADSGGYGRLFTAAGHVYFWVAVPVRGAGGRVVGYVAQLRRVGGNPRLEQQLRGLAGQRDVNLFLRNDTGSEWTTLGGAQVRAPARIDSSSDIVAYTRDGARTVAAVSAIAGTPFAVVAEAPDRSMTERPRAIMRRLGLISVILILLGTAAAWLLSRRLTQPLVELTIAAEGISEGDYARSVRVVGTDEIARLAGTFNRMASQVSESHRELERQNEEAHRIATELAHANERLERAVAEARAANRAKSAFLATMSHEIRTPINAMMGYAELLEMGISGPVTPEQRRQLERVRASGQHLIGLVNEVLDFARIESSQLSVTTTIATAAEVVESSLALVRPQAEAKSLSLTVSAERHDIRYMGDPQRVRQILVNLLTNAVKFTDPAGRIVLSYGLSPRATAADERVRSWTYFRVADTGIGIREDQLERIFEPFTQADAGYTRKQGGSGLGLSISRSLAQLMGGDVCVESRVGHGSAFTLWLPAAATAAAQR